MKRSGFTLTELVLASAIAMILLYGALYTTSESMAVVREGDIRIHTNIHARHGLERFLKDCRYADSIAVSGDAASGWTIDLQTSNGLDPASLSYTWDPQSQILSLSDGNQAETVLEGLQSFALQTTTGILDGSPVITRVIVHWTVTRKAGREAGTTAVEPPLEMAGTSWIRHNLAL